MSQNRLTTIFESQGMLPAQVIKSKLEAAGIPVFLKYEAVGQILGLTVDGLGRVEVQVPEERAEEAREWIAEDVAEAPEASEPPPAEDL